MRKIIEQLAADIQQELVAVEQNLEKWTHFKGIIEARHDALLQVLDGMSVLEAVLKSKQEKCENFRCSMQAVANPGLASEN